MSTTKIYGETTWGIILAEALDSSGGSAGDGLTVNITSTTPTNEHIFLFGNMMVYDINDDDKTKHLPGYKTLTTKIGKGKQFIIGQDIMIPTAKISDMNKITKQINQWRKTSASPIYIALYKNESGTPNYAVFMDNSGNYQNWLRGYIKKATFNISNFPIKITFRLEESW